MPDDHPYPDFIRAGGDVVCTDCGKPYRKHPHAMEFLYEGSPWLNRLCDGSLVKL